jgi:iron complex transport system substrate-binding protein
VDRAVGRIVSLAASNTEIVCALDLADRLVGVDDFSDYPPRVRALPRVGPDLRVDAERVAALQPDLVLASLSVPGMEANLAPLEARGLRTVVIPSNGLPGVEQAIGQIGILLGAGEAAKRLVESLRARMVRVRERVAGLVPVDTYWEWWPRPAITAGGTSWITEMLALAGGRNVFADQPCESRPVALEEVAQRAPQAAVLCWCGARKLPAPRLLAARPGWDVLPAVRTGRVHAVLEPHFGRPGPRLADGVEQLARLLHPELGSASG